MVCELKHVWFIHWSFELWMLWSFFVLLQQTQTSPVLFFFSFFFLLNRQRGKDHPLQEKPWLLHPLLESFVVFLIHLLLSGNAEELSCRGNQNVPAPGTGNPIYTTHARKHQEYCRWCKLFRDASSLEVPKSRLDGDLDSQSWWGQPAHSGGLETDNLQGPLQP